MSACVNAVVAFDRNEGASNSEKLLADVFQVAVAPPVPRRATPIAWRKWFMEWPSGMRQATSWVIFSSLRRPALATARVMM